MNQFYPLSLNLADKRCLILGGGKVAERKINTLLSCGALVTVVSPELSPTIRALVDKKLLDYHADIYHPRYLQQQFLVFCATDDSELNKEVALDCRERGILVNCASEPELCSFFVPAIFQEGALSLTVSTGGSSPALAVRIRDQLAATLAGEYEAYLSFLAVSRQIIIKRIKCQKQREALLKELAGDSFHKFYETADPNQVEGRLEKMIAELEEKGKNCVDGSERS